MLRFNLGGMSCSACSARIENVVGKIESVQKISVSLAASTALVQYDENLTSQKLSELIALIISKVEKIGFEASLIDATQNSQDIWLNQQKQLNAELSSKRQKVLWEALFSIPIIIIAMSGHFGLPLPNFVDMHVNPLNFALVQAFLLIPVLYFGRDFYLKGLPSLFRGVPNMDTLVSLGTLAAFIYSLWSTIEIYQGFDEAIMGIYYESCAMLITLISLGKYFELRSKLKTSQAIKHLMDLSPKTVTLITENGEHLEIEYNKIIQGDRIFIKAGNQVPVDGIILEGDSSLDLSAINGEFLPKSVTAGDYIISGSINLGSAFSMEAKQVGTDTVLAKIIDLVQEAQSSKAPIASMADLISLYFVPAVILLAFISASLWYFFGNMEVDEILKIFVAVLVVACPCALGLATPMSIMVATGRAAQLGLLIKNGTALELAGKINTIIFDKTGTLTEGKPELTLEYAFDVNPKQIQERDDFIIHLAASIEKNSDHPLAKAFCQSLENKLQNFQPINTFEFIEVQEISG